MRLGWCPQERKAAKLARGRASRSSPAIVGSPDLVTPLAVPRGERPCSARAMIYEQEMFGRCRRLLAFLRHAIRVETLYARSYTDDVRCVSTPAGCALFGVLNCMDMVGKSCLLDRLLLPLSTATAVPSLPRWLRTAG